MYRIWSEPDADHVGHECLFAYRVKATFIYIAHVVRLTSADDAEASRGRRWRAGGRAEVAGPGPATCAVDSRGVEKRPLGRRLLSSA